MPKPILTKQAKAAIKQAIANITANPKKFDMGNWCGTTACLAGHISSAAGLRGELVSVKRVKKVLGLDIDPSLHTRKKCKGGFVHTANVAAVLLGLGDGDHSSWLFTNKLFFNDTWPEPFQSQYTKAYLNENDGEYDTKPDRAKIAKIAVRRLRHFLKTGE